MALFKSQVLTQASGSVGGLTYTRTSSGLVMRARANPVQPNTTNQAVVKAAMTAAVNYWTGVLTAAHRASWDLYASNVQLINRMGDPINVSGQNMYARTRIVGDQANTKLSAAYATPTTAPAVFNLGDYTSPYDWAYTIAAGISATLNETDEWAQEDGAYMLVFQGKPVNPSRNYFRGPWRLVGAIAGDSVSPPSDIAISNATLIANGYAAQAGQASQIVTSVLRADGRLSTRRSTGLLPITAS